MIHLLVTISNLKFRARREPIGAPCLHTRSITSDPVSKQVSIICVARTISPVEEVESGRELRRERISSTFNSQIELRNFRYSWKVDAGVQYRTARTDRRDLIANELIQVDRNPVSQARYSIVEIEGRESFRWIQRDVCPVGVVRLEKV